MFITSHDDFVRYEELIEEFQTKQSGLNLFYIDPSDIPSLTIPFEARVIAFDLPTEFVTYLSKGNVSNPQPLPSVNIDSGWKFLGFDVADAITQISAFHGFDLTSTDWTEVTEACHSKFNSYGLINDWETAARAAMFFDLQIPEHKPFVPCGIWLKEELKRQQQ